MVNPLLEFKLLGVQTLTLAGTAQRVSLSELNVEAVFIHAEQTNQGTLYIGDSSVDSVNGIPLRPGRQFRAGSDRSHGATSDIDLKSIYFNGTDTGDKIRVLYLQRNSTSF